jgi:hypothetical protein
MPNTAWKVVNHNISNISYVVGIYGLAHYPNRTDVPYAEWMSNGSYASFGAGKTQVAVNTTTAMSNYTETYVTMEYTCTDR